MSTWNPFASKLANLQAGRDPATCPHPEDLVDTGTDPPYCHGCANSAINIAGSVIVDEEGMKRVMDAISNPPEPTEALKRLMSSHKTKTQIAPNPPKNEIEILTRDRDAWKEKYGEAAAELEHLKWSLKRLLGLHDV